MSVLNNKIDKERQIYVLNLCEILSKNIEEILNIKDEVGYIKNYIMPIAIYCSYKWLNKSIVNFLPFNFTFSTLYDAEEYFFYNKLDNNKSNKYLNIKLLTLNNSANKYNVHCPWKLNAYEKYIFKLNGISLVQPKEFFDLDITNLKPNFNLRTKLKSNLPDNIKYIVNYLPLSVLEFFIHSEFWVKVNYNLYQNLYLNINGIYWVNGLMTEIGQHLLAESNYYNLHKITQVHGGGLGLMKHSDIHEYAERISTHVYSSPNIITNEFFNLPNLRSSRNLILPFKNFEKILFSKKNNFHLVLMPFIKLPLFESKNRNYYINLIKFKKIINCLKEILEVFDGKIIIKLNPIQELNYINSCWYKNLTNEFPNLNFLDNNKSIHLERWKFKGIVHIDPFCTGIMELTNFKTKNFVCLNYYNNPFPLTEYINILKSGKFISKNITLINNKSIKKLYNSSFLYPFKFSKYFKKISV